MSPPGTSLRGPLDLAHMSALLAQADTLARAGTLDLTGVERVDSSGLSFLLELQRRARKQRLKLAYINAPAQLLALVRFFRIEAPLGLDAPA